MTQIVGNIYSFDLLDAMEQIPREIIFIEQEPGILKQVMVPFVPKQAFKVDLDRHDLTGILVYLQEMICEVGPMLESTNVTSDVNRHRVRISNFRRKFVLACYKEHLLLRLLGFTTSRVSLKPADRERSNAIEEQEPEHVLHEVEYIVLLPNSWVEADAPPRVTSLSSIFVYTDIIDYVLV